VDKPASFLTAFPSH